MGGVIRGDDGHEIWLNIDRRAFRMSLCTIQMLYTASYASFVIESSNNILRSDTDVIQTQVRRRYILYSLFWGYICISTLYIYIYIVDPQRFPLRWQPSRWLSVERGRKQTVRRHFGIATAGEWAGSFAATVGCFQRHEVMDPIFLFYNRRSMFLLVGETLYFMYLSVLHFLLPRPISIKLSS